MIETKRFYVSTGGETDIVDITGEVENAVRSSRISNGIAVVFVSGSTAGISTMEYEPNLVKDVKAAFERLFPSTIDYKHHETWGDDNGKSHVRSTFLKTSFTVPFVNKKLLLGTWQQIVLIDFDTRARKREIVVQILGE